MLQEFRARMSPGRAASAAGLRASRAYAWGLTGLNIVLSSRWRAAGATLTPASTGVD